jgi:transposase-like protein
MTSPATTEQLDNCSVCEREITEEAALEGSRCVLCMVCPFCSSTFTLTNRNGVVIERKCQKCGSYTESYLS